MTLTEQQKAERFRKFEATLEGRMERIFERSMMGEVDYDHDEWSCFLDWIEGPLRRTMLYGPHVDPEKRGEKSPAYKAFEAFDRARLQGILDEGYLMAVLLASIMEMRDLEDQGIRFLKLRFKEGNGA
jgi:hypothetical protein